MNNYTGPEFDAEVGVYGLRTFTVHYPNDIFSPFAWADMWSSNRQGYLDAVGMWTGERNWFDGACEAKCLRDADMCNAILAAIFGEEPLLEHNAPYKDCNCGIYGCLTFDGLMNQYPVQCHSIVAVIAPMGRTIMGSVGFRTQAARVVGYSAHLMMDKNVLQRSLPDVERFYNLSDMLARYHLSEGSSRVGEVQNSHSMRPSFFGDWGDGLTLTANTWLGN